MARDRRIGAMRAQQRQPTQLFQIRNERQLSCAVSNELQNYCDRMEWGVNSIFIWSERFYFGFGICLVVRYSLSETRTKYRSMCLCIAVWPSMCVNLFVAIECSWWGKRQTRFSVGLRRACMYWSFQMLASPPHSIILYKYASAYIAIGWTSLSARQSWIFLRIGGTVCNHKNFVYLLLITYVSLSSLSLGVLFFGKIAIAERIV